MLAYAGSLGVLAADDEVLGAEESERNKAGACERSFSARASFASKQGKARDGLMEDVLVLPGAAAAPPLLVPAMLALVDDEKAL